MTSIRQRVLESTVSYLNGADRPAEIPESRIRRPSPENPISGPEINVYPSAEGNQVKGGAHGPIYRRILTLVVECRNVTTDPNQVDSILEPMLVWVSRALNQSDNLGRLSTSILETGTVWTPFYMEKIYSIARVSFSVEYQTSRLDPESHA